MFFLLKNFNPSIVVWHCFQRSLIYNSMFANNNLLKVVWQGLRVGGISDYLYLRSRCKPLVKRDLRPSIVIVFYNKYSFTAHNAQGSEEIREHKVDFIRPSDELIQLYFSIWSLEYNIVNGQRTRNILLKMCTFWTYTLGIERW